MAKLKRGQSKYMSHIRQRGVIEQHLGAAGKKWDDLRAEAKAKGVAPAQMHVNEYGIARTPAEMATKGKYGGLCNRSACLRTESYWYNRGSYAHYCEDCANLINKEFRFRDDVEVYGSLLVQPPADLVLEVHHGNEWVLMYSDGSEKRFNNEADAVREHKHFRRVTGLRNDGSHPLWFKDLSARYEDLRTQVTIKDSR